MLNQCVLTGNLGADPDVFYNPEGNPVTSFNIISGFDMVCAFMNIQYNIGHG